MTTISSYNADDNSTRTPAAAIVFVCLALIGINLVIYLQMHDFGMVFVEEKEAAMVLGDGITPANLKKVFIESTNLDGYCQPVAFLTCMLVMDRFGPSPGPRHMVNLVFHIISTLLLFWFFCKATDTVWPGAMVAALFAAHPINVAPVAWIAHHESGLSLFLLTAALVLYVDYARSRSRRRPIILNGTITLLFLLAMLSHPRVVMFPVLLLLLDYWPLARNSSGEASLSPVRLVTEKTPLFFISGLAVVDGMYRFSSQADLISRLSLVPAALVSCGAYLGRLFLIPGIYHNRYMMTYAVSMWQVVAALVVLLVISLGVFYLAKKGWPQPAVGWLWFLAAMAPGVLMDAGKHELLSERYAYLAGIGLFILVVWVAMMLVQSLVSRPGNRRRVLAVAGLLLLAGLIISSYAYTRQWRNSETLLAHTMAMAPPDRIFHKRAGDVFLENNRIDEAIRQFRLALKQTPDLAAATHTNLGIAFMKAGDQTKAARHLKEAVRLAPGDARARHNLGNVLVNAGDVDGAIAQFQAALSIDPRSYKTYNSLATAFYYKGERDKAIFFLKKALALYPEYDAARKNLKILQQR